MVQPQSVKALAVQVLLVLFILLSGLTVPLHQASGYMGHFEEDFTSTLFKDFSSTTAWGWENGSGTISLPRIFPEYGSSSLSSTSFSLAVKGHYIFLAGQSSGLEIYDISDPTHPDNLATFSGNISQAVITKDDYLFEVSYYFETDVTSYFSIFNVSNPVDPTLIGSLSRPFNATFWIVMQSLFVIDDWAYAIEGNWNLSNLEVSYSITNINISDPSSPSVYSTYVLPSKFITQSVEKAIYIEGNYLYFPEELHGLLVYDISDPSNLTLSGNYTTGGFPVSVFVEDNFAYVVDSDQGLHIFDVTDPTNASLLTTIPTTFQSLFYKAYSCWVENKVVYLPYKRTGMHSRLQVIDVTDPLNPLLVASTELDVSSDLKIFKDHTYIYLCGFSLTLLDAGYFQSTTTAQSITTVFSLGSTLFNSVKVNISCDIPLNTSIDFFLSSDGGAHWEQTNQSEGLFFHSFSIKGSELRWRARFYTTNQSLTPAISLISFDYDVRMRAPVLISLFNGYMTFDNSPTLVWEDISDATGYTLQLDLSPYFNSTNFLSIYVLSSSYTVTFEDSPPYFMEELTPGTWYWRVGAHDMDGHLGTFSATYRLLIDSITHPEDFNLSVGSVGYSITWSPLTSDPESYQVLRDGVWITGGEWTGEQITISVDILPLGIHNFTCTAFSSSGDNVSDLVMVTVTEIQNETHHLIDPPQSLTATASELSVYLNWNPPSNDGGFPIIGYRIYRGTTSGQYTLIFITSGTSYTDTLVSADTIYYYVVTALNIADESLPSSEVSAMPFLPQSTLTSSLFSTSSSISSSASTTTPGKAGPFTHIFTVIIFLSSLSIYFRKQRRR